MTCLVNHMVRSSNFPAALTLVIHAYAMNRDTFNAATKAGEIPNDMPLNRDVALVLMKIIVGRLESYSTSTAEDVVLIRDSELDRRRMIGWPLKFALARKKF